MADTGITFDDIAREVRAVAAERPDFEYQPRVQDGLKYCELFSPDGSPSCIVGHALARLGIDRAIWLDHSERSGCGGEDIAGVADALALTGRQFAHDWLYHVQQDQDEQIAWGECITLADEEFYSDAAASEIPLPGKDQ